jgi:uncharacterized delta-60 repeat protein
MATAEPHARLTWATFALTDNRWLVAALLGSAAISAAFVSLPWFFTGWFPILGLGLVAAVALGLHGPQAPAPSAGTLVRYVLVDATFVAFATPIVLAPLLIVLALAGAMRFPAGMHHGPLSAAFVCSFYLGLAAMARARSDPRVPRLAPAAAGVLVAGLLVAGWWKPYVQYRDAQRERAAGVAGYERASGKPAPESDRLAIGLSVGGFDNRVSGIVVDEQGRLLVAGDFSYYRGRDARGLVRMRPGGELDASFAPVPAGDPVTVAPTRVVTGPGGSVIGNRSPRAWGEIVRWLEDGRLDPDFRLALPPRLHDPAPSDAFDRMPGGAIVAAAPEGGCLARLEPDGKRNPDYEAAAARALGSPCLVTRVVGLASGEALVQGSFGAIAGGNRLVRLRADGTRDAGFEPQADFSRVSHWEAAPGGEIVAMTHEEVPGSSPARYQSRLLRFARDGRLDPTFTFDTSRFTLIHAFAIDAERRVVVTGYVRPKGSAIGRVLADGRADAGFGGPEGQTTLDGHARSIVLLADGHIVLGGEFLAVGGLRAHHIARLQPDGRPDPSFGAAAAR